MTGAPGESSRPSLIGTSDGFAVAWNDSRDGSPQVYFQRLDGAGQLVGQAVRIGSGNIPSLVSVSTGFGLAWTDSRDGDLEIYFQRLDANGSPQGTPLRVTNASGASTGVRLVWTGSRYGLVWHDNRLGNFDIYFVEIDANGNKQGPERPVTTVTTDSFRPALAWSGSDFGVVWNDDRDGNWEIYFARGLTSGPERRVTTDDGTSLFPVIAWSGSAYGVAWGADGGVAFGRVDSSGSKLGPDTRVANTGGGPSLAWNGSAFILAWEDSRSGDGDIYYATLDASGGRTTQDAPVSAAAGVSTFVSVTATPGQSGFGVAWVDERDGNPEIYFARVCR